MLATKYCIVYLIGLDGRHYEMLVYKQHYQLTDCVGQKLNDLDHLTIRFPKNIFTGIYLT